MLIYFQPNVALSIFGVNTHYLGAIGRDRSLITERGGGAQVKVYPYENDSGGGGGTSFGVVLTKELEVLAILKGGGGGCKNVLPCHEKGDGAQSFGLAIFPFCCNPPPPPPFLIINDQSLRQTCDPDQADCYTSFSVIN